MWSVDQKDFLLLRDGGGSAPQFLEKSFEPLAGADAETCGEIAMRRLNALERRGMIAGERGAQQRLEPIGNTGQGRMHDHGAQIGGNPISDDAGDIPPILRGRYAGAPKFEDHPRCSAVHKARTGYSSSKMSRSSFSNCRSASTSSTRLQAALPRLAAAAALGRRSARSTMGSKS